MGTTNNHSNEALYIEQEILDFKDNPLIEALPPILSPEDSYDALIFYPEFNENERLLPTHLRYHAIPRISQFFQPVMQYLDLEQRFSRLLRYGYVSRNPKSADFIKGLSYGYQKLTKGQPINQLRTSASSFTLMGFSGIGKTTAIERVLSLYP